MAVPLVRHLLPLVLVSVLSMNEARTAQLTLERIFAAPELSGPTLRLARLSPDGKRIAYLRATDSDRNRLDLWAYDIASGRHALLADSARLDPQQRTLSAEEEQRRERQRTSALGGIVEYEFSPDSHRLLVPVGGDLFVYDLGAPASTAVHRLTHSESYETDAHFSPRGHFVSFIRDQNLWIINLATGQESAITREGGGLVSCGMAEFIAQEEMDRSTGYWWSPDEKYLAYARIDESGVAEAQRLEIYAGNVKVVKQRYPFAGAANAMVSLHVAALGHQDEPTHIDLGSNPDIYLARVDWLPDSSALSVQRQSRDQKTLTLLKADVASGATRELLSEHSDTWVPLSDELTFLKSAPQFIWASSHSGHRHLYLYDLSGRLLHALTQGDWEVIGEGGRRAIQGLNERRRLLYFTANERTPLERHLYSVPLDGSAREPHRITNEAGWHDVALSKDTHLYLDTFSKPSHPPALTLHRIDGTVRATLIANDLTAGHPYAPYVADHVPLEFGTLRANDGQTLHYQVLKPATLQPGVRYPVIVDVYGGPGRQKVRRAWEGYPGGPEGLFHQYLVQHGYVVFGLDNRGSGYRGVQFESALYHRLGGAEVADQVSGVQWLASQPFVDPKRVGIFGWSYGGFMTLMCMMKAPQLFAAGVAGAPVTDYRLYDTHYTERYMGTPQENPQGYAEADVLTHAAALRAPLLIMHGMADDNVLFTNSTTLIKKLQDLNKPFDVMPYPGSKHGMLRHADTGPHAYAMIVRFFDEHLKSGN